MVAGGYQFRGVFLPRISHQNLLDKSKTSKGKPAKTIDVLYTEKWLIMIAVDDVILVCLYICRECLCSDEVF